MNELLMRLEDALLQLDTLQLVMPGLIAIVLGLFLWLGGARYASLVVGILGAVIGGAVGLVASQWFEVKAAVAVIASAGIFAVAAVIFKQVVIFILAVIIFALAFGSSYLGYSFNDDAFQDTLQEESIDDYDYENDNDNDFDYDLGAKQFITPEAAQAGKDKVDELLEDLRAASSTHTGKLIIWTVLGAVLGLIIAYVFKKILMALCCSIVGTSAVLVGMIMLLIAKDTTVLSYLQGRPKLISVITLGMIIFGCLLQLLVTGKKKKVPTTEVEKKEK